MEIRKTPIGGVFEIYPKIFHDERGYFLEFFKKNLFEENGIIENWVQENQSFSIPGIVRGLHFQTGEYAQAKLVKVIKGKVLDVCVDLRKDSPTFGKHHSVILDAGHQNMLYIPTGFAHGFATMEETIFSYKCSNYYHKASEGGIIWNDLQLDIDWNVDHPILSEKDMLLPTLEEFMNESGGGL